MLILKQNTANSVPTPPAGKGTIFLNTNDDLAVKGADGNVTTFPTAGGSNTQVYFNDDGSFGANANLTFDKTTATLSTGNIQVTGEVTTGTILTTGNVTVGGNLYVDGNITYLNIQTLQVEDPIIGLGGGPNGAPLTTNDGKDRGLLLHYYSGAAIDAFMGWDTGNAEFALASNASVANEVVTFNTLGNLRLNAITGVSSDFSGNVEAGGVLTDNYYYANGNPVDFQQAGGSNTYVQFNDGDQFGGSANFTWNKTTDVLTVTGNIDTANVSASGTLSATGNISGGNLNVSGVVSATGNISGGNLTTAGDMIATGNMNGGNISTTGTVSATGNVSGGNVSATGIISATGNVSGGNLTTAGALVAVGNVSGGNLNTTGAIAATGNITGANIYANSGTIGASLFTGTITTNSQPNITSLGTLTSLTVDGSNITLANGVYVGNGLGLFAIAGANITGNVANATHASTANTVVDAAQPNITSVGTLTSLTVTGNTSAGNISTGGVLSVTGNANVGNLGTAGLIIATGNVSGGNLTTGGVVAATGNVSGGNLTTAGGLSVTGNANVGNIGATAGVFSSTVTATGNVSGGNLTTGGVVSATGNVIGGNLTTGGVVAATGNVVGGNLTTAGGLSVTGNANVGNLGTAGLIIATGNVSGGNLTTGGVVAATGNVSGGNLTTAGALSVTGNANVGNIGTGSVVATGSGSFTGNVSGGNLTTTGILSVTGTGVSSIAGNLDMTSNNIINLATPVNDSDAATKLYVDNLVSSGIHYHEPVRVESPVNLNATYNNGTSGVGATLTNAGANAALVIDGVSVNVADRILVYQQTNQVQNGVYVVTTVGDGSTAWVLTRASDADTYAPSTNTGLDEGSYFFVQEGATGAGESYVCSTVGTITFGTTNIEFAQFGSSQVYNAGTGLTLTNTTFSVNASQTQITSLGNVTTGTWNSLVGGSATFAAGLSGANLASITGGNVTGQVANALVAGTVYTAAQPNITSVGTLTSLAVTGNVSAGNVTCTGTIGGAGANFLGNVITTGANTTAGSITGNWTLTTGSRLQATYADLAEKYESDKEYEPGTVLIFGGEKEVTEANSFDSTKVAGVISTDPAYIMNAGCTGEHVAVIALQGRVPVKVLGPVEKGDLMVSAPGGYAKANNEARAGTIIGKSLENFYGESGIIEVVVGRV